MGLGDTSYEQFNEMALSADRSLKQMGGELVCDIGAANAETYTTEDDFMKWKENLWEKLFEFFGKNDTTKTEKKELIDPSILPWTLAQETYEDAEFSMNMRNY